MSIRLIAGLGNPGEEYDRTPHNVGREVVLFFSGQDLTDWKKEKLFWWMTKGSVVCVIPRTFMNISGEALREALKKFSIQPEEMLICVDDFVLPFCSVRLRRNGSSGGHNGLRSIEQHLSTQNYPRLRLGVGPVPEQMDSAHFVLKKWSKSQLQELPKFLDHATAALQTTLQNGLDSAMNQYNR